MMMLPARQPQYCSQNKFMNLEDNFQPGEYDVICGRGKRSTHHAGNTRFKLVIHLYLDKYLRAKTKIDKSLLVIEIVNIIRNANGAFVKPSTKQKGQQQWVEIGDKLAREKVGHAIRDTLLAREQQGDSKNHNMKDRHIATVDEIMAMSPSDLEKTERQLRLSPRSVCSSSPKTETENCSGRTFAKDYASSASNPKWNSMISQKRIPQLITRQISDHFSPVKLEDMHKLDMSLLNAFLIARGPYLGKGEESPKQQVEYGMPFYSGEIDLEEDDAQIASFLIEALSDDDEWKLR